MADTLCDAAKEGNLEKLQRLASAIHEATSYPMHEVLQEQSLLLHAQPLHYAAEAGSLDAAQWILDNGAYPSPGDDNMVSPLQLASLKGHAPVVAALLKAGASVRMADGDGDTALHWASQNDHLEVMAMLVQAGAEINASSKTRLTPLHRAALRNHPAAVDWLLGKGASVNAVNDRGHTPMHLACHYSALLAVDMLLSWGARADILDGNGRLCWQLAPNHGLAAKALIDQKQLESHHAAHGPTSLTHAQAARGLRTQIAPVHDHPDGHGLASDSSFNEIYPDAVHPSRLATPPVAHTVTALEDDQSRSMGKPLHAGAMSVLNQELEAKAKLTSYLLEESHEFSRQRTGSLTHHLATYLDNQIIEEGIEESPEESDGSQASVHATSSAALSCMETPELQETFVSSHGQAATPPLPLLGSAQTPGMRVQMGGMPGLGLAKLPSKARPHANKQFLNRYGLGEAKLFAP